MQKYLTNIAEIPVRTHNNGNRPWSPVPVPGYTLVIEVYEQRHVAYLVIRIYCDGPCPYPSHCDCELILCCQLTHSCVYLFRLKGSATACVLLLSAHTHSACSGTDSRCICWYTWSGSIHRLAHEWTRSMHQVKTGNILLLVLGTGSMLNRQLDSCWDIFIALVTHRFV
jgi:hypothetical protein